MFANLDKLSCADVSIQSLLGFSPFKVMKKAEIRKRYNQVSHLTQDTGWERDKNTAKRLIQESQEVSPFPAGDHKAARHRQLEDNMAKTNTNTKPSVLLMGRRQTVQNQTRRRRTRRPIRFSTVCLQNVLLKLEKK